MVQQARALQKIGGLVGPVVVLVIGALREEPQL
jgi:hypothetical protein